ncbi:MAG: (Fe-S)-binding protein [Bernardetiaceae bacterium]|jgi:heterodisulfide reductase subunit C|nr:(Fe-S)-binding protein [Bernardetiaceae bacterium]
METFATLSQQIIFMAALLAAGVAVWLRIARLRANINLGRPLARRDRPGERLRNMLLIAFGQKKMFERPFVGFMHLVIYASFLLVNIEILEIVLDGLTGHHRLFAPWLGGLYPWLIGFFELLAVGVIGACVVFLVRRYSRLIPRFWARELTAWPRLDATLILLIEIGLMLCLLTMNATDTVLQGRHADSAYAQAHFAPVGSFLVSGWLAPLFRPLDTGTLIALERGAWWLHILGIMGFSVYITYSKHLHIALAFPNTYFADLEPKGKLANLPTVTTEVRGMLGLPVEAAPAPAPEEAPARFGAKDVTDLTWKNLLDAYTCTECGRCSAACPANLTGKLLSPRKIMMDTRDRADQLGQHRAETGQPDDGKALYGDFITKEELLACTTCNACVDACPVNINPLDIIVQLRQYMAMEESSTPASWNSMFANVENNGAPWAFSASDRFNWATELQQKAD